MPELQHRLEVLVAQLQRLLIEVTQGCMAQVILMPCLMERQTQLWLACACMFDTNISLTAC